MSTYCWCFCVTQALPVATGSIQDLVAKWCKGSAADRAEITATYDAIEEWDTSNVTSMAGTFSTMPGSFDLSKWDTSKVTSMEKMFFRAPTFNGDVSTWDTSKVTSMHGMFFEAASFNSDVSKWDTSKVTNMRWTFAVMSDKFNQPLGQWSTASVVTMEEMFRGAAGFNQDISSWGPLLAGDNRLSSSNMFGNSCPDMSTMSTRHGSTDYAEHGLITNRCTCKAVLHVVRNRRCALVS